MLPDPVLVVEAGGVAEEKPSEASWINSAAGCSVTNRYRIGEERWIQEEDDRAKGLAPWISMKSRKRG